MIMLIIKLSLCCVKYSLAIIHFMHLNALHAQKIAFKCTLCTNILHAQEYALKLDALYVQNMHKLQKSKMSGCIIVIRIWGVNVFNCHENNVII